MDIMGGRRRRFARARRESGEQGAAAVEFALVASMLFSVLIGMFQYGFFFNDALNARQAVRETLRQGVVRVFDACGTASTDMAKLKCLTVNRASPLSGTAYAKVDAPATWAKAAPLKICALVKSDGGFGFLPLPNDGWLRVEMQMSIEQATAPLPTGTDVADTLPAGQSWSWC